MRDEEEGCKNGHEINEIFCPNVRNTLWFAVADAYKHWYDVPEREVLEIISNSKYYTSIFKNN